MQKTILCVALGLTLVGSSGCRGGKGGAPASGGAAVGAKVEAKVAWIQNFEEAKRLAAETKRPILADFTGSDWCGWCIKLDKEVFSQAAFQTYAEANLVLFVADFPRKAQADDLKKQNRQLADQYGIEGFPTILLLDATGKELARTGYRPDGAEEYVAHLKSLLGR